MHQSLSIAVLALVLDLAFGDPARLPHPVRLIGRAAARLEGLCRTGGLNLRLAGTICLLLICLGAWFLTRLAAGIPVFGVLASIYLAYAGLALGGLVRECRAVHALIEAGRLDQARQALGLLVSREVAGLDESGLRRTLAETLSENLNDAFAAPFFFLVLFGVPGLWTYKAVSTLDSMWGYRTPEYARFGWASARADDVLAFVPARLTAGFMVLAGWLMGLNARAAFRNTRPDARKTESPNAGWPMAAAAWLCGASMGGPAVYFGQRREKPVLGPQGEWTSTRLAALLRLTTRAGLLAAAAILLAALGLGYAF
ncbi:MAG: adenosylcobinamide-phosphate synthase CbiB [Desulfovibrionaceae bacterium]|nr:cobalamin biosynthesis protein CobD [Desulfovibrionaceae bacterium]MDD4952866.1 adenosylcobinamide-phosphate synthase CbiB [Desulfovibrionaceae bacterium]